MDDAEQMRGALHEKSQKRGELQGLLHCSKMGVFKKSLSSLLYTYVSAICRNVFTHSLGIQVFFKWFFCFFVHIPQACNNVPLPRLFSKVTSEKISSLAPFQNVSSHSKLPAEISKIQSKIMHENIFESLFMRNP